MEDKLDPKEAVSLEELVVSNTYTQEALVNLMVKKGLIQKDELLEEIKQLKAKLEDTK